MERFLLAVLILPLLTASAFLYFRNTRLNFNAYEIFIFFTTIYAVLVPLDHLLGLRIREHESFPSLNYDPANPDITYDIIFVVILYYFFFVSVSAAYFVLRFVKQHYFRDVLKPHEKSVVYSRQFIPSSRSLVLLNVGLLALYIYFDIEMLSGHLDLASSLKQVRTQLGLHHEPIYRLFSFSSNIFVTFNTLIIILGKEKRSSLVSLSAVILMSLYTGDRSTLLIVIIIAVLVHKPVVRRVHSLIFMVMAVLFFVYFKPTYNFVVSSLADKEPVSILESYSQIDAGFSRIEALSPFEVIRAVVDDIRMEKQYGATYLITTIKTAIPSMFYESDVPTLAVQFKEVYAPSSKGYFGFSPIAEAVINFGYIGIFVVGLLLGIYLFMINSIRIGVFYYLNIMIIIRFFRTDFASLVKRYYVVESTAIILVMISLTLIYYLYKNRGCFITRRL